MGAFSYQWLRSGDEISGATAATYEITADDEGHRLTLEVSYTDGSGFDEVLTSANLKVAGFTGIEVVGTTGDDTLFGSALNDSLNGNAGADTLFGAAGEDLLIGGRGDDNLVADAGSDRLYGGKGDDQLWGGLDADKFIFGSGFGSDTGADTIHDFEDGIDLIQIKKSASGFADLNVTQAGNDVLISYQSSSITLIDTDVADITQDDFLF